MRHVLVDYLSGVYVNFGSRELVVAVVSDESGRLAVDGDNPLLKRRGKPSPLTARMRLLRRLAELRRGFEAVELLGVLLAHGFEAGELLGAFLRGRFETDQLLGVLLRGRFEAGETVSVIQQGCVHLSAEILDFGAEACFDAVDLGVQRADIGAQCGVPSCGYGDETCDDGGRQRSQQRGTPRPALGSDRLRYQPREQFSIECRCSVLRPIRRPFGLGVRGLGVHAGHRSHGGSFDCETQRPV
jgi:hypothetical protein